MLARRNARSAVRRILDREIEPAALEKLHVDPGVDGLSGRVLHSKEIIDRGAILWRAVLRTDRGHGAAGGVEAQPVFVSGVFCRSNQFSRAELQPQYTLETIWRSTPASTGHSRAHRLGSGA